MLVLLGKRHQVVQWSQVLWNLGLITKRARANPRLLGLSLHRRRESRLEIGSALIGGFLVALQRKNEVTLLLITLKEVLR